MTEMLADGITVLGGAIAGGAAGAAVVWHTRPRGRREADVAEVEQFPEDAAHQMAHQWRVERDLPEQAEAILFGKLKLGWDLQHRRRSRARRWRR